ncbi:hypothetical protein C2845_PM10G00640 [Panicum miliaceum]|uniref:Uncharacterized protein n=1 Tax=Panicum miliaceum TaxID=4540 RepID=A0A3L6PBI5_PANMI|nr:hypothetical protein C2845_PM10G00640 [Panicum miliaceum]
MPQRVYSHNQLAPDPIIVSSSQCSLQSSWPHRSASCMLSVLEQAKRLHFTCFNLHCFTDRVHFYAVFTIQGSCYAQNLHAHTKLLTVARYQRLTRNSIVIDGSRLSPLGWSGLSWAIGILIVAPILTQTAHHLDRGQYQSLILIAATSFGSFFCLLTGFFKTVWVFLFYILFVAGSIIVAEAVHTRNLGLMIRGLAAHDSGKHLVLRRRAAASQLSLYCTAIGGIGAALMAAFMYHMLRRTDQLTGLWVVSIFSGLIWFIGICHGLFTNRPSSSSPATAFEPNFFTKLSYSMTLLRYPQAIGRPWNHL